LDKPITEQLELFDPGYAWDAAYGTRIALPGKLASLRQKLYLKAKQEPKFRFYALYDRVYRPDVLEAAYRIARTNKGAAGMDGVDFKAIEGGLGGVEAFLAELHESLKSRSYKPNAVRRAYIEKPDGRQRPLGIPTIRDRVVQTAAVLILEPIFEADFLDCSYGFRPNRSAHDALETIRGHIMAGRKAIYDADLKSYFDTIPHDKLMACLRMRIADNSVLKLIRMWLNAPVAEKDESGKPRYHRSKKGTPQGGSISPLLSNVYLHWFDKVFHFSTGPAKWAGAAMVRYADDLVILARYQGDRLRGFIEGKLESWLGLELNRNKTKIVGLGGDGVGLDFLGYTFRFDKDLHGRGHRYLNITPSRKALKAERAKIRELVNRHRSHIPVTKLIQELNGQLTGWYNYFCYGYPRQALRATDGFVRRRLIGHLRRRSQRPYRPPKGRSFYAHLKALGLVFISQCHHKKPVCALS
jgi:RNA-directed DNA polymerase